MSAYSRLRRLKNALARTFIWRIIAPLRYVYRKLKGLRRRLIHIRNGRAQKQEQILLLQRQRETKFEHPYKISILLPAYNTPEDLLRKTILSVVNQTYSNWQLCIADASSDDSTSVQRVVHSFSRDTRIVCRRIANEGISENTNICAQLADGDFVAFLDHDDVLTSDALFEVIRSLNDCKADVIYSDEDKISESDERSLPFFKPDWSPDLLHSQMYVCHFLVVRKQLFDSVGGFDSRYNGAQDFDLMLRLSEKTKLIKHIPKILYSWRQTSTSTSVNPGSKPYAENAGLMAVDAHLKRVYGEEAFALNSEFTYVYDARFPLPKGTKVSVIIPTKDHVGLLKDCVESILENTSYSDYEIILVNNNSEEKETFDWFDSICAREPRVKVVDAPCAFNWSRLNNIGMQNAAGDVFIFLNNDTRIISCDWIERLAENALREDIGVIGALLLYEDGTIQHAGVVLGMNGWADHVFKAMPAVHFGMPYVSPMVSRNVLAVTGACMAVSRATIGKIGPFDEEFIICGSDVEICLRAYRNGLNNLYNANVKLYHFESKSRDSYIPETDFVMSQKHYSPFREEGDPFYNPNLEAYSNSPRVKE